MNVRRLENINSNYLLLQKMIYPGKNLKPTVHTLHTSTLRQYRVPHLEQPRNI